MTKYSKTSHGSDDSSHTKDVFKKFKIVDVEGNSHQAELRVADKIGRAHV